MDKYGVLLEDLRIETLGKYKTIRTVVVFILHKLLFAVSVVVFNQSPVI